MEKCEKCLCSSCMVHYFEELEGGTKACTCFYGVSVNEKYCWKTSVCNSAITWEDYAKQANGGWY
jgi:hypothetical protein